MHCVPGVSNGSVLHFHCNSARRAGREGEWSVGVLMWSCVFEHNLCVRACDVFWRYRNAIFNDKQWLWCVQYLKCALSLDWEHWLCLMMYFSLTYFTHTHTHTATWRSTMRRWEIFSRKHLHRPKASSFTTSKYESIPRKGPMWRVSGSCVMVGEFLIG